MDALFDTSNYYQSLPGNPRLVARGDKPIQQGHTEVDESGNVVDAEKKIFVLKHNHPLAVKLKTGLRATIKEILATMNPNKWISVDYLRIGYSETEDENPVVILVTVEEGFITEIEGKRISRELEKACFE